MDTRAFLLFVVLLFPKCANDDGTGPSDTLGI
jgi:hypothetical protein